MKDANKPMVPLEKKVFRAILRLLLATLLVVGAVILFQLLQLRRGMITANVETGREVESLSSQAMEETMEENLLRLTEEKAASADKVFSDLGQTVSILAKNAEYLYKNNAKIKGVDVHLPDRKNGDALDVYVTYSEKADRSSKKFQAEQELLGNLQWDLLAVRTISRPNPASCSRRTISIRGSLIRRETCLHLRRGSVPGIRERSKRTASILRNPRMTRPPGISLSCAASRSMTGRS